MLQPLNKPVKGGPFFCLIHSHFFCLLVWIFLKNIHMVPLLAKPGQNGSQILLEDVKTCKKKSFYRMLMFFIIYTGKRFFWVPSSKIKIQHRQNVREQTKSSPELMVPFVLITTDILEGFLGKVVSLVRSLIVLYWRSAVCTQHSWLNRGISNYNLDWNKTFLVGILHLHSPIIFLWRCLWFSSYC